MRKDEPSLDGRSLLTSEDALRGLVESAPVMMGVVELAAGGEDIVHVYDNPAAERYFGFGAGLTVGRMARELGAHPDAVAEWVARYRECERLGRPVRFEYAHRVGDREAWLSTVVAPMAPAVFGTPRFSYVTEDITLRRRVEEGARRNSARWRFLARLSDALRKRRDAAAIAHDACGLLVDELSLSRCTYTAVAIERDLAIVRAEASHQPPSLLGEHRLSDYGGAVWEKTGRGETVAVRDVDDDPLTAGHKAAYAAIATRAFVHAPLFRDGVRVAFLDAHSTEPREWSLGETSLIEDAAARVWEAVQRSDAEAELARANESLAEQAVTDPLTGLGNRRAFDERLRGEIFEARRLHLELSLVMIDVDRFKEFNDSFGHPAGDEALRTLAKIFVRETREYDVAARYGGEEFALLLPNVGLNEVARVAERVRQAVERTDWAVRPLTASLGVATFPYDAETPENLVQAADRALYAAKEMGRNRVASASSLA